MWPSPVKHYYKASGTSRLHSVSHVLKHLPLFYSPQYKGQMQFSPFGHLKKQSFVHTSHKGSRRIGSETVGADEGLNVTGEGGLSVIVDASEIVMVGSKVGRTGRVEGLGLVVTGSGIRVPHA